MKLINAAVAFTMEMGEIPAGFQPLTGLPLVIVVGLTGVGKSTVLERLSSKGLTFSLLPNRREITDEIIIASLQAEARETPRLITDRVERFEYTARYRAKFPGGMAHALSRVIINPNKGYSLLIFDGLRGLNEVRHAVDYFPQVRFIVLDASDTVRLNRLLQRGDIFDTTVVAGANSEAVSDSMKVLALKALPNIEAVFSDEQLRQIVTAAAAARIRPGEVLQKVSIIVTERHNYDSGAARDYLVQTLPAERVLVVDTAVHSADEVAGKVVEWLGAGSK